MSKERRSEIKKNQKLKIILPIVAVVLAVVIGAVVFAVSAVNKCDECEATFYGS